jgi:hypothetical protein
MKSAGLYSTLPFADLLERQEPELSKSRQRETALTEELTHTGSPPVSCLPPAGMLGEADQGAKPWSDYVQAF